MLDRLFSRLRRFFSREVSDMEDCVGDHPMLPAEHATCLRRRERAKRWSRRLRWVRSKVRA